MLFRSKIVVKLDELVRSIFTLANTGLGKLADRIDVIGETIDRGINGTMVGFPRGDLS